MLSLNRLRSFFGTKIAMDLGTANTLIYTKDQGIVLDEPSVVALNTNNGGAVLAVGKRAKEMYGRTPESIKTVRPMKDGVIADFDVTKAMIRHFIGTVIPKKRLSQPTMMVCVPSGITSVEDLRGKRISLDREGSGTRVDGLLVLKAYGLTPKDMHVEALSLGAAADRLRAGELDGFFMIAGTPANAIVNLADDALITLVPLDGPNADKLRKAYPFFAKDRIPAGTYFNTAATDTLSVGAQWLVSADLPEDLIYNITRALWHPSTRRLLDSGHPKGKKIVVETALEGLVVPIHPGARRYYSEAGIALPPDTN